VNWYAVRGNEKRPVRFCHYWKDRPFKCGVPIPAFLVRKFDMLKSRYATHVRVEVDDQCEVSGYTLCMQEDQAERELGRWEAILKIEGALYYLGWRLEREDGASMHEVEETHELAEKALKEIRRAITVDNKREGLKRQPAIRAERAARRLEKGE